MPEHDAPHGNADTAPPGEPTTGRRGRGPVARAWNGYGARVRGRHASLRGALTRAVFNSVASVALFAAIATASGTFGDPVLDMVPANPTDPGTGEDTGDAMTPAQQRALAEAEEEARRGEMIKALNVEHDCYTGQNPTPGVDPRYAVVTLPGEDPALLPSTVGFGIWLNGDPGQHHSFCP